MLPSSQQTTDKKSKLVLRICKKIVSPFAQIIHKTTVAKMQVICTTMELKSDFKLIKTTDSEKVKLICWQKIVVAKLEQ